MFTRIAHKLSKLNQRLRRLQSWEIVILRQYRDSACIHLHKKFSDKFALGKIGDVSKLFLGQVLLFSPDELQIYDIGVLTDYISGNHTAKSSSVALIKCCWYK